MDRTAILLGLALAWAAPLAAAEPIPANVTIAPAALTLTGATDQYQLLVSSSDGLAGVADRTADCTFTSANPSVARVTATGMVIAEGDGETEVRATVAGQTLRVRVTIRETAATPPVRFGTDVIAALSRAGCNQGACHGSLQGKNGFKLSLRGENPDADFLVLTHELNGRRLNLVQPESSLLLMKATGRVPH